MNDGRLPEACLGFRDRFSRVTDALGRAGQAADAECTFYEKTACLVESGLATVEESGPLLRAQGGAR